MNEYVIYCLADGVRLVTVEWVDALDDEDALRIAATMKPGTRREVWHWERLIGKIEVDPGE